MSGVGLPAMYLGEEAFSWSPWPVVADVVRAVAHETGVARHAILGDARDRRTARVRYAAMFVASVALGKGLSAIGRALNRDHSTVALGLRRAMSLRDSDPAFRALTDKLIKEFTR